MGNFGQSAKGGPFAKISKLAIVLDQLWKAIKSLILVAFFSLISMDGAQFILVSVDTKISMKQQELAEK